MRNVIFAGLLLLIGCSQFEGDKGDKGDPGPGQIFKYTGLITSDAQVISIPRYLEGYGISVLVTDPSGTVELPFFSPPLGVNVFYMATNYVVTIYNAQSVGASSYKIYVFSGAIPQSQSGWAKIFP